MTFLAYTQLPISCMIILLFLLFQNIANRRDMGTKFIPALICSILFVLFDMMLSAMEDGVIPFSEISFHITYFFYNATGCMMTFSWFRYSEILVDFGKKTAGIMKFFHWAAAVCLAVICIPPLIPCFYEIGADGSVTYVYLDYLWYVMHFLPGVIALVEAFKAYTNIRRYAVRERYMPVLIFDFILILSAFLQNFIEHLFAVSLGIMLVSIYMNIVNLRSGIFVDVLTGLNNRRQFLLDTDSGMKSVVSHHQLYEGPSSEGLSLILMDIDDFKLINDKYGHNTGDFVLIDFSNSLKRSCGDFSAKIYRYGGDEFAILVSTSSAEQVRGLCRRIKEDAAEIYDKSVPYKVSVSVGYAVFDPIAMKSIPAFTEAADKRLYNEKQEYHNAKLR